MLTYTQKKHTCKGERSKPSMSRPFKVQQIKHCPLCNDPKQPQHMGHGVMWCECCGNRFRVVQASPGKTGKKLSQFLKETTTFGSEPKTHR